MNKSVILKNKIVLYLSFLITFFIFIYLVYFLINGQRGLLKYFYLTKQAEEAPDHDPGRDCGCALGRRALCHAGLVMEEQAGERANKDTFDTWTIVHGAAGFLARRIGLSWPEALGAALGVEALEVALSSTYPKLADETRRNQLGDMVVFVAGYYIADRAKRLR